MKRLLACFLAILFLSPAHLFAQEPEPSKVFANFHQLSYATVETYPKHDFIDPLSGGWGMTIGSTFASTATKGDIRSASVTVTLPPHVTYDGLYDSNETITVSTSGQQVTITRSTDQYFTSFSKRIKVKLADLEDLPADPPSWEIPISGTLVYEHTTENLQDTSNGFWLYVKPEITLAGGLSEVVPDSTIQYQVNIPAYPHANVVEAYIDFVTPTGTVLKEETLGGISGERCLATGSTTFSFCWPNGHPEGLSFDFGLQVRPRWYLDIFEVTEFLASIRYVFVIDETYRFDFNDYNESGQIYTLSEGTPLQGTVPSNPVVNSTGDRGLGTNTTGCDTGFLTSEGQPECTLRSAIEYVNGGFANKITFNIPGTEIPTISLTKALPEITKAVTIDASTQSAKRVLVRGNSVNASGFVIKGGSSELRNLVIQGFQGWSVTLSEKGGNKVFGCYLGTDVTGAQYDTISKGGMLITGSGSNEIGSSKAGEGNVISASGTCIFVNGEENDGNLIRNNRLGLGTDGSFTTAEVGIAVESGDDLKIEGNRIAASLTGVYALGVQKNLTFSKNRIGLNDSDAAREMNFGLIVFALHTDPLADMKVTENKIAGCRTINMMFVGAGFRRGVVSGNQIGMKFDDSGELPSGLDGTRQSYGLRLDGASDLSVSGNVISGHLWNMLIAGYPQVTVTKDPTTGAFGLTVYSPDDPYFEIPDVLPAEGVIVTGNTIGVNETGYVPSNAGQKCGILLYAKAKGTQILNNSIMGHEFDRPRADIQLDRADDVIIRGNHIGTQDGSVHGSETGIKLTRANGTLIENNVIGRTSYGVTVGTNADGVSISGNTIGADPSGLGVWPNEVGIIISDYAPESDSPVIVGDNIVSGNTGTGISVSGSKNVQLLRNFVGTSQVNAQLPNRDGIIMYDTTASVIENTVAFNLSRGISLGGSSSTATMENNRIYGNGDTAIVIDSTGDVSLVGNIIGLDQNNLPSANEIGIYIDNTTVTMSRNTVANSVIQGIVIEGNKPVSIGEGPVYGNGDGSTAHGIHYVAAAPLEPPIGIAMLRGVPDANGMVTIWLGVPPYGGGGQVTIEVFGNSRNEDPQGQVPLARRTIAADQAFGQRFDVGVNSLIASYKSFSATVTRDGATSEFTTQLVQQILPVFPALDFLPSGSGVVTIGWPAGGPFLLEQSGSLSGGWTNPFIPVDSVVHNGVMHDAVTIPLGTRDECFYRLNIDWDKLFME